MVLKFYTVSANEHSRTTKKGNKWKQFKPLSLLMRQLTNWKALEVNRKTRVVPNSLS